MRKSSNSRVRVAAAAGLTTSAVGAALLVAPTAAFAAVFVSPPVVPAGDTTTQVTITDTTATFFTTGTPSAANRVQILTTGTSCVTPIPTATTAILAATSVSSSNSTKSVTFTLPANLTAGTNGQVKRYLACIYEPTGGTARVGLAAGYPISVGAPPTVTPLNGTTGGGNTVTVSTGTANPVFTGVTTPTAVFTSESVCPAAYGTQTTGTPTSMATTVTKTSESAGTLTVPAGVTSTTADTAKFSLCVYNGNAAASTLITAATYNVTQIAMSNYTGPFGGGNNLNITSPNPILAGIDQPGVIITSAATCPGTFNTTQTLGTTWSVQNNDVRKVGDTRLAVTVPALYANPTAFNAALTGGATSIPWQVCVYNGTDTVNSKPIAAAPYNLTTLHTVVGVSPRAGTALGGSRITVSGTGFPLTADAISATLGGSPLTNITPLTTTAFSATTPAHIPANNTALVVTTNAGSVTYTGAYSFTSALQVRPNTAPNTRSTDVVVNGLGFQSSTWSGLGGAHIYLVDGVYSSTTVGGNRANPPVDECGSVLVLSDSELICRLDLTNRLDAPGTAAATQAPTAITSVTTTAGSRVLTSITGWTPTPIDIGKTITDTGATPSLPTNTTVVSVLSSNSVLVSNPASASGAVTSAVLSAAGPTKSVTGTGAGSTALATVSPSLESSDVGLVAFGQYAASAGNPITAQGGTSATVTGNLGTGTGTFYLFPATGNVPVPEGAYNLTYVSNGSVGAVASDANYVQSGISSGSTFTVSSF